MAIDFTATTDRYEATGAAATDYPVSFACWFYADTLTAQRTLVCLGSSTGAANYALIGASSSGVVAQSLVSGVTATATSTTAPSTATWHHAAGVFASSTDRRAFIDGGSKGTNATSNSWPSFINRTLIGQRRANGAYSQGMDGRIMEAAIWNAELSDDDVYSLSRGYSPRFIVPKNLVFYAPMIRDVIDLARGRALTATGSQVVIEHTRRIG